MKITIDNHEINIRKNYERVYEKGSMLCRVTPFDCPLTLEIAITPSGEIIFREWNWNNSGNGYLHVYNKDINVTKEMIDTVNGLFSGRILVEGLKLAIGNSIQELCPINLEKEEELSGKKIYLSNIYR